MIKIAKIILRALAVILIGFASAVIGFIAGLVIGGTLAGIFEIVFGYPFIVIVYREQLILLLFYFEFNIHFKS